MAIIEDVNSYSDEERDEGLDEDIEALRAACLLTGETPDEEIKEDVHVHSDDTQIPSDKNSIVVIHDDDDDDFELVRNIKEKFSVPPEDGAVFLKPLNSLPPVVVDDDNDDFETLRLVRRRFTDYDADAVNPEALGELPSNSEEAYNNYQPSSSAQNQSHKHINWHQSEAGFPNPEAARLFVEALRKNRSCQKFIRSKLLQIEAKIEENKKLKERVKILKDFQVACRRRAGQAVSLQKDPRIQLISVGKFRKSQTTKVKKASPMSFGPVENSHVAKYRMVLEQFPLCLSRPRWSQTESENLSKGIKQQFQEMLLQESLEVLSTSGDSNDLDDMMASIADFEVTPENIRTFLPKVDWERLASTYVTGRSGAECEQRWLNMEDPLLNHCPWTKNEDKKLLYILQQGGIYNWINISIALGTNRTPFQCLARYQRSLNANILKRDWTNEDDRQLRTTVEAYGENNWQLIAFNMEGWTGAQCRNRWSKTLNPARKRVGRWTVEEDKRLKVAVLLFGAKTWQKMAQFIPGRTQVQCRERWVNCLDPSLNLKEWTEEEDCQLKDAVEEYGHCWSKVAASLPGRTDNKCMRRWKMLFPHEVPLIQAAKKIRRTALISNFVARESERPALDHNDFIALPGPEPVLELEGGTHAGKEKKSRRRPKSKATKDLVPCDGVLKRRSSKRSRTEAQMCSVENSRIQIVDDEETCGEDGTKKKKSATNRIQVVDEEETCGEDGTKKKKSATNRCSKRKNCKKTDLGNNPLTPEDSTISMITEGEHNIVKCGEDGIVLRRKRKAPTRRLTKNHCTNIDSGNISLLPEDSTTSVGDNNTANCGEDDIILRKKKRLKNNQTTNTDFGDFPLLLEDSTTLMINAGSGNTTNCGGDDVSLVSEDLTVLRTSTGDVGIDKGGTVSGKKTLVYKRNRKGTQSTNTVSGKKNVPEESAILKIAEGEKSTVKGNVKSAPSKRLKRKRSTDSLQSENLAIASKADAVLGEKSTVKGNEKSAPSKRLKRKQSTDSLLSEDLSSASIAAAVSERKKRSISKRSKPNRCTKPASDNDNSLCPEDTAVRINDGEDSCNNNKVVG